MCFLTNILNSLISWFYGIPSHYLFNVIKINNRRICTIFRASKLIFVNFQFWYSRSAPPLTRWLSRRPLGTTKGASTDLELPQSGGVSRPHLEDSEASYARYYTRCSVSADELLNRGSRIVDCRSSRIYKS